MGASQKLPEMHDQECSSLHFVRALPLFHHLTAPRYCGIVTKEFLWWKFDILKIKNLILPLPALKIYTPRKFLESTLTDFRVCWGISSSCFNCCSVISPINYHACLHLMLTILQCKVASESCMNASRELVLLPCYLFIHCCLQVVTPDAAFLTVGMGLVL